MSDGLGELGLGIGWRPELALAIHRHPDLGFVELTAENHDPSRPLPEAISQLMGRGVDVVVHGVSLSLGGAEPPERPPGEALEGVPDGADRGTTAAALTGRIGWPVAAATGPTGGPKWTPGAGRPRGAGRGCARCTIGATCRPSATP